MDILKEETCAYCGSSNELVDAVSSEEVLKLCSNCAKNNGFPVIVKATIDQINKSNRFYGVKERLEKEVEKKPELKISTTTPRWVKDMETNRVPLVSQSQDINEKENKMDSLMSAIARSGGNTLDHHEVEKTVDNIGKFREEEKRTDKVPSYSHAYSSKLGLSGGMGSARELKKEIFDVKQSYDDLVDNFHWHIQQGRRLKKISQKQLASMIAEKEELIVMAEQGRLPSDYAKLVSKLEQYLGIKIKKKDDSSIEIHSQENEQNNSEEGLELDESGIKKESFFSVSKGYFKNLMDRFLNEKEEKEEIDIKEEKKE